MSEAFAGLGVDALRSLADAMESGQIAPPYGALSVQKFARSGAAEVLARELSEWARSGLAPAQLALVLKALAAERDRATRSTDHVELVWSGPELPGSSSRDTSVVVRELFASAQRSVIVSGYAVYQGRRVFEALASALDANPTLSVRMFLNIHRNRDDERADPELTREFAERLRSREWPGERLPVVYYDPRDLESSKGRRACLHAKCIVVDNAVAFVTSANFTEAAHERNIEAGVLLRSTSFASSLTAQFDTLVQHGALRRLAGLG